MKNEVSSYIENIALLILGIFLLAFPLIFLTVTTDFFSIPKQALLGFSVLAGILLFGANMIALGKVRIKRAPFDIPVLLLALAVIFSAVFAQNRWDSILALTPFIFAVFLYFLIFQFARGRQAVLFLSSFLLAGAVASAALHALSYFSIYPFPIEQIKVQTFTPMGSLIDHSIYLLLILPIAIYSLRNQGLKDLGIKSLAYGTVIIIIIISLSISTYQLISSTQPGIGFNQSVLPFETGFQTAFAAISQDTGRTIQGFLLGSGFGTFVTDFTRFKHAAYNQNPALWSITFFRSSSFLLEILATVGFLGIAAFVFLVLKIINESGIKDKARITSGKGISILLFILVSFLLPFSFVIYTLFFIVLALFAAKAAIDHPGRYFDIELQFVAAKKSGEVPHQSPEERSHTKVIPVAIFIVILAFVLFIGYWVARYVEADLLFQKSFVSGAQNNALETYNNQRDAIGRFPYRDGFYRIYAQTNLSVANSLATALSNQEQTQTSNTEETRQTIINLIQQSINAGRTATSLSPQTMLNWQNLAAIYRSLIGFGQGAEQFAIASQQRAIALDPNNPNQYISMGGIYFQLRQWEQAQNQFQIAISLKPDFANAYYNLGHALEEKGDPEQALIQYQTVKTLVANDQQNLEKITAEIEVLQSKIGSAKQTEEEFQKQQDSALQEQQPPLGINEVEPQLPEQKPPVEIPGPTTTP